MIYKQFGNSGVSVSQLGFGAMRLPMKQTNDSDKKRVDYDLAVPLMHKAFDMGVNYLDTAPYYCDSDSETAVLEPVRSQWFSSM